jgi:Tol biopolymer transport system component
MRTLKILLCLCFSFGLATQVTQAQDVPNIILGATWSPDGEYVSYLAFDGIHLIEKNGDNHRLLSPPTGFGGWTSDSSGVLLIQNNNPAEATFEWWIYPIDGSHPVQFLPELRSINALAYSHDGDWVAISAQENESDPYMIWVANADGSELRPLAEYQAFDLNWSSDDTHIIFETLLQDSENRQVGEVSIDVSGIQEPQTRPLEDEIRSIGDNIDFRYEADTSYLPATFYITDILEDQESIFTVNQWVADIDYSEVSHSIVYAAYCDVTNIDEAFLQGEWSAAQQETVETALYLVDLGTGEQTELVACGSGSQTAPSFSPDGQEILFIWVNDDGWNIYTTAVDEASFVNLTEG